jgi:HEAT repeat protein
MDPREIAHLRHALESADDEIRRLAVEGAAALPRSEAVEVLLGALGDLSWRVRKAAVERWVALPEAFEAPHALVRALADSENAGRRNAAVEALVHCGARALPALLDASRSDDADVRKLAVDALAGIGDASAVPRLVESLDDPDPNVQAAAADALAVVGGADAQRALLALAMRSDADRLVRFAALRALGRLEASLEVAALGGALDDPVLRPPALQLLGHSEDPEAARELVKGLVSGGRASREAAMEALLRALGRRDGGDAACLVDAIRAELAADDGSFVASALARLERADLATRMMLVQFLGLLARPEVVVPLLRAGRDEALTEVILTTLEAQGAVAEEVAVEAFSTLDPEAQRIACELLGRTRGAAGEARLLACLDAPDVEVRVAAAHGLARRAPRSALERLVARLAALAGAPEPGLDEEREALCEALGRLAESREELASDVVRALAEALAGASDAPRVVLARLLAEVARAEDVAIVRRLQKDVSPSVRRAAVQALGRLEPAGVSESLRLALADEVPSVRVAAAHALGNAATPDVIAHLRQLADDPDPQVRSAALRAVGRVGRRAGDREAVVAALTAGLADDGGVAMAALEALQELGGAGVAVAAFRALDREEGEILQAAIACLRRHATVSELQGLLPLVEHADWAVRAEVIQTLADRRVLAGMPVILRRLDVERDAFVREEILRALARLEG